MKGDQVGIRTCDHFSKHINLSEIDPGRAIFAPQDTPHSRFVKVTIRLKRSLSIAPARRGSGYLFVTRGGEGGATATPIRACTDHVAAD